LRSRFLRGLERQGELGIINRSVLPGESPIYFATSKPPIVDDYGLISIADGPNPLQRITLLAGTTTYGTQAAAEFVSDPRRLQELWERSGLKLREEPKRLSAVIHVKIRRGVPLIIDLVAVRTH
jgi:hypothetical protein